MKLFYCVTVLIFFSTLSNSARSPAAKLYLETKMYAIKSLGSPKITDQKLKINAELLVKARYLIRQIVPSKVLAGFREPVVFPETFLPELGRDYSDGYLYSSNKETFFVSSLELFEVGNNFSPRTWPIITNAATIPFLKLQKSFGSRRIWLVLAAQDIGPFPPNTLYVLAIKSKIVVVLKRTIDPIEIPLCARKWGNSMELSENKRLQNYINCYQSNLPASARKIFDLEARSAALHTNELLKRLTEKHLTLP